MAAKRLIEIGSLLSRSTGHVGVEAPVFKYAAVLLLLSWPATAEVHLDYTCAMRTTHRLRPTHCDRRMLFRVSGSEGPLANAMGQYRHGERTKGAIAEQRKFSALLKMLRAGLT